MSTHTPGPLQNLTCCSCGEVTPGRQWPNRDKGYGLCTLCAVWLEQRGTTASEMKDAYGVKGTHYAITK